ncbi:MAG TPA: hypothetical protein VGS22_30300 [Thermoanaerobaculia bacterium]|jgi:Tol biopolymer transport system component|nr:hypothetical protein [Thermoanaerobaculia bacterium]
MHRTSWFRLPFLLAGLFLAFRPAMANDLELVTRANPISDTPVSAGTPLLFLFAASFSEDERYVAYPSIAPNASPGQIDLMPDTPDVFLWDRTTGGATLVSHAAGDIKRTGNAAAVGGPSVSTDGRFVTFVSNASDLVAGQIDGAQTSDVFFWDRDTGLLRLVSHAFNSAVTAGNSPTGVAAMSADGSFVLFLSSASNLLPGTGSVPALYLWDRDAGTLSLVSHRAGLPAVPAAGTFSGMRISADGGVVAFESSATDLVAGQVDGGAGLDLFVWTRATGASVLASRVAGTVATAADLASTNPSLSRDGRYVAYLSASDALIPGGDGNPYVDVYLFDRVTGTNTLVSHASGMPNVGADSDSSGTVAISADGSTVLYSSLAANLVPGQVDDNGLHDLFLWRRALDQTMLVSHRPGSNETASLEGALSGSISADGSRVAFIGSDPDLAPGQTDPTSVADAYLFDRDSGIVSLASHRSGAAMAGANDVSAEPILSQGGNYLLINSSATDLVAGVEDWNVASDLYLYDRATTENRLVTSHAPGEGSITQLTPDDGFSLSTISADGQWVAFNSFAQDLAGGSLRSASLEDNLFLYHRATGTQSVITRSMLFPGSFASGPSVKPSLSADGRFVAYVSYAFDLVPGQSELAGPTEDIFLFDREANASVLVSHRAGLPSSASIFPHTAGNPRISADGRFVAYFFWGPLDAGSTGGAYYLYDRLTGVNTLVTHLPGQPEVRAENPNSSIPPAVSADGRFVAYNSSSSELVAGVLDDPMSQDIFLYDRTTGENQLVTRLASSSNQAAGGVGFRQPAISADGRYVAYTSNSPDLAPGQVGDGNPIDNDVFLWDRDTAVNRLVSHNLSGAPGDDASEAPALSADGRFVAFLSVASNLVPSQIDDPFPSEDVFLFDRDTDSIVLASHAAGQAERAVGGYQVFEGPALSADGSRIAYSTSSAEPVVAGQSGPGGIFVYDRVTGTNLLASHRPGDATHPGNTSVAFAKSISADGSAVTFALTADDLVAHDHNDAFDVFVHATSTAAPTGAYFTVPPCRLLDTRAAGQAPALASTVVRALTASGNCGVPSSAKAIAVTLTVTGGTGGGHLSLFPGNLTVPATAALNFAVAQTRSSNAIATLATNGAGTLGLSAFVGGGGTVEAIVDVFGYFE